MNASAEFRFDMSSGRVVCAIRDRRGRESIVLDRFGEPFEFQAELRSLDRAGIQDLINRVAAGCGLTI